MKHEDIWFEPKAYGVGSGMPVAWQGWALLLGYIAVIAGLGLSPVARHPVAYFAIVGMLTLAVLVIAARHTRGGWRWRWGSD